MSLSNRDRSVSGRPAGRPGGDSAKWHSKIDRLGQAGQTIREAITGLPPQQLSLTSLISDVAQSSSMLLNYTTKAVTQAQHPEINRPLTHVCRCAARRDRHFV